jgi:AdoMet-dependent heme synthase
MIPFQENDGGLVCLLPNGRVEFVHPAALPAIHAYNSGAAGFEPADFEEYVLTSPLVEMEQFHLSAPAITFIETTNLCNLRCKHCYADSGFRRPNEIDTDIILSLIDEFARIGVLQVFLTGGEIFAHRDAVEIIRYAKSKPFSTQVFTNGLLITEAKLAALPPTSFFISFDTADPERTVRGKMDFPTLRQRFEWMKAHGHVFRTAISVHRNNVSDAEEIFRWCLENGYPRPQWLETHPVGRALLHPDMLLEPKHVEQVFAIYQRCMDLFSEMPDDADPPGGGAETTVIHDIQTIKFCQRLERATGQEKCARSMAYVTSAGDVYPCSNCMSTRMFRGGNIRERSFSDIWESGFDSFRGITFDQHTPCAKCPVAAADIWCQFRCPPLAANVSHDLLGCGATDYLKMFMLRANAYWEARRQKGIRLTLAPPRASRQAALR